MARRVLIATPTTLLAMLHAVAYGWQQERVAESAQAISELGRELHGRLVKLSTLLATLGTRLNSTVRAYNDAVGSYEAPGPARARAGSRTTGRSRPAGSCPRSSRSRSAHGASTPPSWSPASARRRRRRTRAADDAEAPRG